MSKVFLGVGHGGKDPGAVSYLVEKTVNLVEALACRNFLEAHGVQVLMSRTGDEDNPLTDKIKECNAFKPDLAVDIHNNAGNGDGFEAYYHYSGDAGKVLAENIEAEVKKIGQNSRGCKTRVNFNKMDYHGFIRKTNCPAVIVEGCFVDNATDIQIANTVEEQETFGIAYAKGILKTFGISIKEDSPQVNSDNKTTYYVQIGAFSIKENADEQLQKARNAGFSDAFVRVGRAD